MRFLSCLGALAVIGLVTNVHAGVYEDLIIAAKNDNAEKVMSLIERGADVDSADQNGTSLVMFAARAGNEKLLGLLLKNHAKGSTKNAFGDTAMSLAAFEGHLECVKLLTSAGAPLELDGTGWSPLSYAAFAGRKDVAEYLIGQGAKVNARAPNSMTPLMLAARNGHTDMVKLLLDNHADRELKTADNKTAREIAIDGNQTVIAELLSRSD